MAYIKVNDRDGGLEGLQSPIVKFAPAEVWESVLTKTEAKTGDLIFFGADKAKVVNEAMGALRVKVGLDRGLAEGDWKPLWLIDFPMFDWDDKNQRAGMQFTTHSLRQVVRLKNLKLIQGKHYQELMI